MPRRHRYAVPVLCGLLALAVGTAAPIAQARSPDTSAAVTTAADRAAEADVKQVLERFSRLIHDKNPAIVDEFADDALLCGSEPGEIAIGKLALRAFLTHALAKPYHLNWEWQTPHVQQRGNLIWFFVESTVVTTKGDKVDRGPYRVSGVIERTPAGLRWRQYNGSEPAVH